LNLQDKQAGIDYQQLLEATYPSNLRPAAICSSPHEKLQAPRTWCFYPAFLLRGLLPTTEQLPYAYHGCTRSTNLIVTDFLFVPAAGQDLW